MHEFRGAWGAVWVRTREIAKRNLGGTDNRCIACRRSAFPAIQAWVSEKVAQILKREIGKDPIVTELDGELQLLKRADDETPVPQNSKIG